MQTSPVNLHKNIRAALQNAELAGLLVDIKDKFVSARAAAVADFNQRGDFEALRESGRRIADEAIRDMPELLEQFAANAEAAGATVLWAKDAARARQFIVDIAKRHEVKMAVKSKSMASEEIFLNDALAAAGVEPVETDLGEFIIQLEGEMPSHILMPAMHKTRASVAELFRQKGVAADGDDIPALTAAARAHLRKKFLAADMGISGANFLIAESGSALITTNEGNGRMVTTFPRVHVTLAPLDKILPSFAALATMLPLLTRSATGQFLSNYVSVTTGARRTAADDGPEHVYIVLLDNGRAALRGGAYREILRCIRCGACMNHCPVYQTIGGHAYGAVYMGPVGQVMTPALTGIIGQLPYATTTCGACAAVCPVKIPLPKLMRRLREERVARRQTPRRDRLFIAVWSFCARRPKLYAALTAAAVRFLRLAGGREGNIHRLPGLSGWFGGRDLSAPPGKTFREMWKNELQEKQK